MSRKYLLWALVLVVVIVLGSAFCRWYRAPRLDRDGYQAVMLTNGIAYFGHVENVYGKYLKLTDVYYLQQSNVNPPLNLIKFGTEPQGPQDTMYINRSQILYIYNLDPAKELYGKIQEAKKNDAATTAPAPAKK